MSSVRDEYWSDNVLVYRRMAWTGCERGRQNSNGACAFPFGVGRSLPSLHQICRSHQRLSTARADALFAATTFLTISAILSSTRAQREDNRNVLRASTPASAKTQTLEIMQAETEALRIELRARIRLGVASLRSESARRHRLCPRLV